MNSDYPFIKLITPENMVGYSEMSKMNEINKIFNDSYKSPLSVIVIDSLERLLGKYNSNEINYKRIYKRILNK